MAFQESPSFSNNTISGGGREVYCFFTTSKTPSFQLRYSSFVGYHSVPYVIYPLF